MTKTFNITCIDIFDLDKQTEILKLIKNTSIVPFQADKGCLFHPSYFHNMFNKTNPRYANFFNDKDEMSYTLIQGTSSNLLPNGDELLVTYPEFVILISKYIQQYG